MEPAVVKMMDDFFTQKIKYKEIEDQQKKDKQALDKLKDEIIEQMEASGLTALKDERGRQIFLQKPEIYASIRKGMKDEAYAKLKEWGLGDIIQPNVHAKTLSGIIKERLANDDNVPEDIFGYFIKKKLGNRS